MVGYWAGWYFSKINRNFKVSQRTNIAFWVGTFTIINFMIFIQHFQEPMPIVGALYSAFGRTTWSLATTYIILACTSGYGGFVAKFLHSKFFVPLSRISYSSYLLNPLLYLVTILSCEKPFHLDLFTLVSCFKMSFIKLLIVSFQPILLPGFLLVLHLVSFIFTVLIESPITKTVSYIVKK